MNGDLLGLAGVGSRIAALVACTVILRGDMADQLLDNSRNPAWEGQTFKLVTSWPDRLDLWEEYGRLRADGLSLVAIGAPGLLTTPATGRRWTGGASSRGQSVLIQVSSPGCSMLSTCGSTGGRKLS